MNISLRLTLCCGFLFAPALLAQEDPPSAREIRRHLEIRGPDGARLYEMTEVIRFGDETDENHLLIHDEGHGPFIMRRRWSFPERTIMHRISDVKDRTFVQHSYKTAFTSKTRLETLDEARKNPALGAVPALIQLETNGGEWDGVDSDWDAYRDLRRVRHDLRRTIDPFLLEAIERMRGVLFSTVEGAPFYSMIGRYVMYDRHDDNAEMVGALSIHDVMPSCDFDKSFGYACSEKQAERVKKAQSEGTIPERY